MCLGQAFPALPTQLLATLLIQYERLRGVQSSGVLVIFWLLCVICAIIPFRSKILSAVAEVRGSDLPGLALPRSVLARLKVTVESRLLLQSGDFLSLAPFMLFLHLLCLCSVAGSGRSEPCREIGQRSHHSCALLGVLG